MPAPCRARTFAATLAVTVSACGGDGVAKKATGTTAGGRGSAGSGADVNPVSRDRLNDGGTLVWPLASLPGNFNTGGARRDVVRRGRRGRRPGAGAVHLRF